MRSERSSSTPVLPVTPALFVVVHQTSAAHAVAQSRVALNAGADGVFLINHYGPPADLVGSLRAVRGELGDGPWVGVNPLGLSALDAARFVEVLSDAGRLDGLWCDNAGIDEATGDDQPYAASVAGLLAGWNGSYFGGVAFKYQRSVADLEAAARAAAPWMDVICSSGPGTGRPADIEKLGRLADGAEGTPVAVASGVDVTNVVSQVRHVSAVLAATSVSFSDTALDPVKIAELVSVLRGS